MIVHVTQGGTVTVEHPCDFKRFKMVAEGSPDRLDALRAALLNIATLSGSTQAWIYAEALRALVSNPTPAFEDGLSGMIELARGAGWVRDDPLAIAAHVEWTEHAAIADSTSSADRS